MAEARILIVEDGIFVARNIKRELKELVRWPCTSTNWRNG
jgi:hypothetical protein